MDQQLAPQPVPAEVYPPTAELERLIASAKHDQGMVSLGDAFASLLGRVLPGGAVIERPPPRLEWLVDLPKTEALELRLRLVDRARRENAKLPDMPRDRLYWPGWYRNEMRKAALNLERARHRDGIQLGRPEGCWCLGLGYHAGRFCTCPEAQKTHRQHEVNRQAYLRDREYQAKERRWQTLAIPEEFEEVTFDLIVKTDPSKGRLVATLQQWFIGDEWLILYGMVGRGKTALAVALLKLSVGRRGQSALMVDTPLMLDRVRATYQPDADEHESDLMEPLYSVDVLLLDDLGAHTGTNWELTKLRNLINYRSQHRKRTIVTTNLDPYRIGAELDERIGSRLLRATIERVDGDDMRIRRKVVSRDLW